MLENDVLYVNPSSLVTFAGLHDMARFMSEPGATTEGLELAETFLLTARGIPMIYYGDEIGMMGGEDPENRRDFPGEWSDEERRQFQSASNRPFQPQGLDASRARLLEHIRRLTHLRARLEPLRRGSMIALAAGEHAFTFARVTNAASVIVAINNGLRSESIRCNIAPAHVQDGSVLEDRLGHAPDIHVAGAVFHVDLAPRSAAVFALKGGRD